MHGPIRNLLFHVECSCRKNSSRIELILDTRINSVCQANAANIRHVGWPFPWYLHPTCNLNPTKLNPTESDNTENADRKKPLRRYVFSRDKLSASYVIGVNLCTFGGAARHLEKALPARILEGSAVHVLNMKDRLNTLLSRSGEQRELVFVTPPTHNFLNFELNVCWTILALIEPNSGAFRRKSKFFKWSHLIMDSSVSHQIFWIWNKKIFNPEDNESPKNEIFI